MAKISAKWESNKKLVEANRCTWSPGECNLNFFFLWNNIGGGNFHQESIISESIICTTRFFYRNMIYRFLLIILMADQFYPGLHCWVLGSYPLKILLKNLIGSFGFAWGSSMLCLSGLDWLLVRKGRGPWVLVVAWPGSWWPGLLWSNWNGVAHGGIKWYLIISIKLDVKLKCMWKFWGNFSQEISASFWVEKWFAWFAAAP